MERDSLRRLYEFDVMESVSDSRMFILHSCACFVTVFGAYWGLSIAAIAKRHSLVQKLSH